jgi:hypothetical protein
LQVKPQLVPSQVAALALAGSAHGVQLAPHELGLALLAQSPLQSWVPACAHTPLHESPDGMQAPAHSFDPGGQLPPHAMPSQVALPPVGATQGVQLVPHEPTSVLEAQRSPHTW